MALILDPPDLIDTAALTEGWADNDKQHCARMLRDAFEDAFQVKRLQQLDNRLIAWDAPFAGFESVTVAETADKPVLQALSDLSERLLAIKSQRP